MRVGCTFRRALLALRSRRALCISSLRFHSSISSPAASCSSHCHNTSSQSSSSTQRVATRLNARSSRMRDLLLSQAQRTTLNTSTSAPVWLVDEIMEVLQDKRVHSNKAEVLHPLLCVELIRRLGPAVVIQPDNSSSERRGQRGWAVPYINTTNTDTITNKDLSCAGTTSLRVIYEEIVSPLLPMLTRWAETHTGNTTPCTLPGAVRGVLHIVVEWLAVLPCLYLRNELHSNSRDSTMSTPVGETVWANVLASWTVIQAYYRELRSKETQSQAADSVKEVGPTLAQLLPYILLTASTLCEATKETDSVQEDKVICILTQLFALVQGNDSTATTRASQQHRVNSTALTDELFWQTDMPLLSHDIVRRAYIAYTQEQQHTQEYTTPGAVMPVPSVQSTTNIHRCVLRVAVKDDDAFRRFLLRLEALQGALQECRSNNVQKREGHNMIYLVPSIASPTSHATDYALRLVLPLHDYLRSHVPSTITTTQNDEHTMPVSQLQACDVQLGFEGVLEVLTVIFDAMQVLRRTSRCTDLINSTQATQVNETNVQHVAEYTLLPHKPRIHALKRICERLLQHARWVESVQGTSSTQNTKKVDSKDASRDVAYFTDVPITTQVTILRRLCGASRALVRLVMREKQESVLEDTTQSNDIVHSVAAQAGGAVSMTTTTRTLGEVLRNVAYRLIEPELRRYYVTHAQSEEQHSNSIAQRVQREAYAIREEEVVAEVQRRTLTSLYSLIGKEGALPTARTILRHPSAHSTHALIEAIRLMGMCTLLFNHTLHPLNEGSAGNMTSESDVSIVLDELLRGFDCVWQRMESTTHDTQHSTLMNAASEANLSSSSSSSKDASSLVQLTLSERLLMLVLLIVRHYASQPSLDATMQATSCDENDESVGQALQTSEQQVVEHASDTLLNMEGVESVLRRLLTLWTHQGTRSEWIPLLPSLYTQTQQYENNNNVSSLYFPPASLPSGCVERWELVEELRTIAAQHTPSSYSITNSVRTGVSDEEDVKSATVVTWRWLGSPLAVTHAVRDIEAHTSHAQTLTTNNNISSSSTAVNAPSNITMPQSTLYLLLPWSTLANARHPLRLYDEDGRSAAAGAQFDCLLHRLLRHCINKNSEANNNEGEQDAPLHPSSIRVVVRLVSLAEELRFFPPTHLSRETYALAPDVLVVQDAECVMCAAQERDIVCEVVGSTRLHISLNLNANGRECEEEEDEFDALD